MGKRVHRRRPVTSQLASRVEELVLPQHHHNVDDIVEELRSKYSEYGRCKFGDMRRCINSILQEIKTKHAVAAMADDDDQSKDEEGCSLRKRRRLHSMSTTGESNEPTKQEEEEEEMTKALRGEDLMLEKDLQLDVVDCGIKEARGGSYECGGGGSNLISGEEELEEVKKEGPLLRDFGGIGHILEFLINEVIFPLCNPQLHQHIRSTPLKGILFHGPPGCGKTRLAHVIANEAGVPLYSISGSDVVSGVSGESEQNIRDLFSKAYKSAPSIIFIDEIDAIASKRENLQREMEKRIVTQLLTCMDESYQSTGRIGQVSGSNSSPRRSSHVFVIGATNRLDALDAALRRPGRFDREIYLGVPDETARHDILSAIIGDLRIEDSLDLKRIAKMTPGFVGADLVAVVNKAASLAIGRRINTKKLVFTSGLYKTEGEKWRILWEPNEFRGLCVAMADFEEAISGVQPSSMREGFSPIPDVTWSDVGGVQSVRRYIEWNIVRPIKHPEEYEEFGMSLKCGLLLFGPPGCGKTLIAQALANEVGASFICIKGPEILSKYVGESESQIRTIFKRARACAPCILFFDEVDALTTSRGNEGAWVVERLVIQFLAELDGIDKCKGVYVIGATNRLDVIDDAMLRSGRFGEVLYIPLPDAEGRQSILEALAKRMPVSPDVDFDALSKRVECQNLTGADLSKLMQEAGRYAIEEKRLACSNGCSSDGKKWHISSSHFEIALKSIRPSVSEKVRKSFEDAASRIGSIAYAGKDDTASCSRR